MIQNKKFEDFINNIRKFWKVVFRNCKIHVTKDLLFKEGEEYMQKSISLKDWKYYLEKNKNIELLKNIRMGKLSLYSENLHKEKNIRSSSKPRSEIHPFHNNSSYPKYSLF